jgi:O-antigen/teichoic acid export membrane protein
VSTGSGLAQRFVSAVQWNVAIAVVTIGVQFGITAVTARLLTPADFGLFAIANVIFVMAANITGMGLILAIVREPVLDREVIGSTVLLSCSAAAALALIGMSAALLAGRASGAQDGNALQGLLQLISLAILISGIGVPAQAIMQRELRFRELGLVHLAALVLGMGATTVALALLGEGPRSLAYGCVAYVGIVSAGCWWRLRDRWSITWRGAHIIRIGRVGMQMSLVRLLDSLWTQMPLIIANAQLSSVDVGLYQRAQSLVDTGIQATTGRVNSVIFPAIATRQDHDGFLRDLIPPVIGIYSLFLLPATTFVVITASDIVALMLGPGWRDATEPLMLIMIAYMVLIISQPASSQLEVRALFRARILGAGFGAAGVALLSLVLVGKYGLNGIAVAAVISGAGAAGINLLAMMAHLRVSPRHIIEWVLPAAGITGLLALSLIVCSVLIGDRVGSPALRLAIMASIAFVNVVVGFRLLMSRNKRQMLSNYVFLGTSPPAMSIARIFGFPAGSA